MNKNRYMKAISVIICVLMVFSVTQPVFSLSTQESVINSLTKICDGYQGHMRGVLMPVYVTSPDFTIEEGTGVELYGSLETSIYADKVRFYHNGIVSATYNIIDLTPDLSGTIITLILYGGNVYRIRGTSLKGLIGTDGAFTSSLEVNAVSGDEYQIAVSAMFMCGYNSSEIVFTYDNTVFDVASMSPLTNVSFTQISPGEIKFVLDVAVSDGSLDLLSLSAKKTEDSLVRMYSQ